MRQVEIDVVVRVARMPRDRIRLQGLDTREVGPAELIPHVDLVRGQRREEPVSIRNDLVDDLGKLRPPAPIQRIRNQDDLLQAVPALEFERPDANRKRVVGNVVDVRIFRQQMLGQNARVRATT